MQQDLGQCYGLIGPSPTLVSSSNQPRDLEVGLGATRIYYNMMAACFDLVHSVLARRIPYRGHSLHLLKKNKEQLRNQKGI